MTGRYNRGRHDGRGGRGGKATPKVPNTETKKKKTIEDYFFYVGSSKQASDFKMTSKFLVNHVKKTFDRGNDVAEALRTLEPQESNTWRPTLQFSATTDPTVKAQEDQQLEI
jgi:hypothetical protein